eukprot:467342_1
MQTDSFGMWLILRKMKPKISIKSIQNHQNEIIEILGGIDKIIDCVLHSFGSLSFDSSRELISLFNKISDDKIQKKSVLEVTIQGELETDEEPIHILDLADDLLSNICSFLHLNELICFDKTCIDISRICHCPSSVYEFTEYEYEKLSKSIDKQIKHYITSYEQFDKIILSDIVNAMSEKIDVHRFTKLKKICIDTRLTAEIPDLNQKAIHPMTQYFIFQNIINKLSNTHLESLTISHFEVKESAIFNYPNRYADNRKKIIDLKDYFPSFTNVKKLYIPWKLKDEDAWEATKENQYFSFVFSHIYGVQHLDLLFSASIPNDFIEYINNNKNGFNLKRLRLSSFMRSTNELQKCNKALNIVSLNCTLKHNHLFLLCQQTLHSLHLDWKSVKSVIKTTDLSNITFIALKELCLKEFDQECFAIDKNEKNNYFRAPNLDSITLNATEYVSGYHCAAVASGFSIMDVLYMFDVRNLSILTFKGGFSGNVSSEYGNKKLLYWLKAINACLNQKSVNFIRINVDLKFIEEKLWDYKSYHLSELADILDSFDATNNCETISLQLKCVCTAKYYLYEIRDSASQLGWNVDIGSFNWRYITHAKMKGELHTFRKGPINQEFIKYTCCWCSS